LTEAPTMTSKSEFLAALFAAVDGRAADVPPGVKVCRCGDTHQRPGRLCAACDDQRRGLRSEYDA
jgi:hypothetical protein